jgi:hypothetical protein
MACVPEAKTVALLAELSNVGPYFEVGTGPVDGGWRPVGQLYTDTVLLDGIIGRVQARIDAAEQRVAASTFSLGFAARLWSIGLGALAGHRLLPNLAPEHLLFRETDGQIRLHIQHPVAWQGDDLEPRLADMVLDAHLAPLSAALRQLGPISEKVLRGNAASALLGAARVFDRDVTPGSGWKLARRLCADERLSAAIRFDDAGYRRTSCCLYYRIPGGGLCGDCVLTNRPRQPAIVEADGDGREQVWPLPTDEQSLLDLIQLCFEQYWDEIWFGTLVQGAAWEVAAPNAPKRISMYDGYATVDFGRWHFHLCIGEHRESGPELGRIRRCSRAELYRRIGSDGCPTSWGVRLFNGRDEQMMTLMLPNPFLTNDQQLRDQPAWQQLELWDRLRSAYLGLEPDPFDRSGKGFRHG